MPRHPRDSYYVDLIERVHAGVQVTDASDRPRRGLKFEDARGSPSRDESSTPPSDEVIVAIGERRRPRK